jgi:hypothetical protein
MYGAEPFRSVLRRLQARTPPTRFRVPVAARGIPGAFDRGHGVPTPVVKKAAQHPAADSPMVLAARRGALFAQRGGAPTRLRRGLPSRRRVPTATLQN